MTPERWQQVEKIFQSALEREPAERAAFLDEGCAGDPSLRSEVESLIAAHGEAGSFIEPSSFLATVRDSFNQRRTNQEQAETLHLHQDPMDTPLGGASPQLPFDSELRPGTHFGPYNLISLIGQGGFGQVWEAENLETGRRVALKVLLAVTTASPEFIERFKREGRLAASLNHPNCVYIFTAEEVKGYPVISMELMAGGTLQDLIDKQGRLPVKQAVDYVVDILQGLEAAHGAGIIHRDIKPSNCFLDERGKARIGDFGLSKSSEVDTGLTVSGTFMGTPSYSSPEQVRGREVDHRSDIYSLGATLYALLTGKPPYEGKGTGEVLARIISEEPKAFVEHKVDVPKGLQRVVLRTLSKDKGKRYRSSTALREALLPYSSEGLTTAGLGKRFAAIVVDNLIFSFPGFIAGLRYGPQMQGSIQQSLPTPLITTILLSIIPVFVYFFITEGRWGRSPGKFLFGLRVTTSTGGTITWSHALSRTALYILFADIPSAVVDFVSYYSFPGSRFGVAMVLIGISLYVVGVLAMVSTMRQSNGYAGVHELLSNTRVREARRKESILVPHFEHSDDSSSEELVPRFGPYRAKQTVWKTETEALLLARDDVLNREVWVHQFNKQSCGILLLTAARPGRLYWLQGAQNAECGWNCYEAPTGASLCDWVMKEGRLTWAEMRQVLFGLVTELKIRYEDGDVQTALSIRHIWVDAYGQAKLLDFPGARNEADNKDEETLTGDNWRGFLHQVVLFGLQGKLASVEKLEAEIPKVPLPEYVRPVINRLCGRGEKYESPVEVIEELKTLQGRPARITRGRRIGPIAVIGSVPLFLIMSALLIWLLSLSFDQKSRTHLRELKEAKELARLSKDLETLKDNEEAKVTRAAARKILARKMTEHDSPQWKELLRQQPEENLEEMESALAEFRDVTDSEVSEARRTLEASRESLIKEKTPYKTGRAIGRMVGSLLARTVSAPEHLPARELFVWSEVFAFILLVLAIPTIISAFIFRGGILLYVFGITVQTREGRKASRFRCLLRAIIPVAPLLIIHLIFLLLILLSASFEIMVRIRYFVLLWLLIPSLLFVFLVVIYSIIKPENGIQDVSAGTQLVPR